MIPEKLLPDDSYPIGNIQVSEGIATSNNIVLEYFLTFWGTINMFSIKLQMVPQAYASTLSELEAIEFFKSITY